MIWRIATIVLAVALVLVGVTTLRRVRQAPEPLPPPIRAALELPADMELGAGDDILDAAVSPDGRQIVFVASSSGVPHLWRRAFDADRAELLTGTDGASMPTWKRSGGVVSFFSASTLKQISLSDGAVRDLADARSPAGASWLADGSLLYASEARGPIKRLRNSVASDATMLREGDVRHASPETVGDTGDFLYVADIANGRRIVRFVRNGTELDLTRTSGHAAMVGDLLVHVMDGALSVQRFDPAAGTLTARPARLAFDVGVAATGRAFFAASPRLVVWAASAPRARQLAWFDLQGQGAGSVSEPADYWQVRLSPDDRTVAATMLDPLLRTLDVFAMPTAATSGAGRRVTLSITADSDPVWAQDGSRIAFRSMQGGQPGIFARPPQFSEEPDQPVLRSELDETPTDWRGGTLLFHAPGSETGLDVWALDVASGNRREVARTGFNESDARWSPDGRWLAYVSDEPGRPEIFVARWPQDGRRWRVTSAGGTRPRWLRDGRGLFFLRDGALMRAELVERDAEVGFGAPVRVANLPGVRDYDLAHLSDRLLAVIPVARAESPRARVIVDWMSQVPPPPQ